jgi:hypothetical protein
VVVGSLASSKTQGIGCVVCNQAHLNRCKMLFNRALGKLGGGGFALLRCDIVCGALPSANSASVSRRRFAMLRILLPVGSGCIHCIICLDFSHLTTSALDLFRTASQLRTYDSEVGWHEV